MSTEEIFIICSSVSFECANTCDSDLSVVFDQLRCLDLHMQLSSFAYLKKVTLHLPPLPSTPSIKFLSINCS